MLAIAATLIVVAGAGVWLVARGRTGAAGGQGGSGGSSSAGVATHGPLSNHEPQLPPREPTGSASLSGFVVDGAGLPVAGAEVSAEPELGLRGSATGSAARTGSDAGSDAGSAAGGSLVAIAPVTAGDGRFAIPGLAPGRYRLRVSGAGLLAAELRFVQVPADATRIVVARRVAIEGRVTDEDRPVPGAHVGLRGDDIGGEIDVDADGSGEFHVADLPEGRYQVFAWQDALAARAVRIQRLGAGPFGSVELRLETATIVVGRVVDRADGTGVIAAVELRPSGDDQAPRYARSGDDGVFRIEGVPHGRWIAEAFAPGYLAAAGIELEAGRGIPELQLVQGGTVEGRVLDGDGHPVAGAVVRALGGASASAAAGSNAAAAAAAMAASSPELSEADEHDRLRRYSGRTVTAAAAPTGHATGMAADPDLLPRGELGVMLGPIPPLPPPGGVVAKPATIEGAGVTLAGEPTPLKVDPDRASMWTTGDDGRYRIRGVPKGAFSVLAQADGFAEGRSKPVAMTPPEVHHDVDIVVSAGSFLVGRVADQHGNVVIGAQLSAQPAVGAPVEGFTDASGDYRIGPVAGALRLHVSAYGHVDADLPIELPPPRGRLAGEHREDILLDVADAVLAGMIDDDSGAPVASAHLAVVGGGGDGRHAIAGADGTFELDLLPPGPVHLVIEHPDYPPTEADAVARSIGGDRAHLVLPVGGAVEGALLDHSSGDPLTSVTISGTGPRGQTADATTDKAGMWKLGPLRVGRWHLVVKQPGYVPGVQDVDVTAARVPGATSVRDIRIELARGAIVGGTVRDASGHRVPGAHVVVRALDPPNLEVTGDSDAAGEFRIRDCPTGELDVAADKGDEHGTMRVTVRPAEEVTSLQIDVR